MEFRVPATDKPTFFNKDTALGALAGFAVFGIFGAAAGAAIGGYLGKNRMEKEAAEGKIVKEPTTGNAILSKDTVIGGLAGGIGGHLAGLALAIGAVLTLPLLGVGIAAIATTAAVTVGLGTVGGALYGAFTGSNSAKARMDREYFEARQQGTMAPPSVARSQQRSPAPTVEYDVPEGSRVADLQRRSDPATAQYLSGRSPS